MLDQVQYLPAEVCDCWRIIWFISSFSLFSRAFSFSSSSTLWQKRSKDSTSMRHTGLFFFLFIISMAYLLFRLTLNSLIYKTYIITKFNFSNRKTQNITSELSGILCLVCVPTWIHWIHLSSPFPASFSLSCGPSPAPPFELKPPAAAPSAFPAHPAVTSADLRPAHSGPGPVASGACSPPNPKWHSLAAAVHSEPWSLWTEHKGQLVKHYN